MAQAKKPATTAATTKPVAKPVAKAAPTVKPAITPKPAATKTVTAKAPATKPAVTKTGVAKPVAKAPAKAANAKPALTAESETSKAPGKRAGAKKVKLVRDTFTFPQEDHDKIASLKQRLLAQGAEAKKSEVLRAGLQLLSALTDAKLVAALQAVERVKTGRPAK